MPNAEENWAPLYASNAEENWVFVASSAFDHLQGACGGLGPRFWSDGAQASGQDKPRGAERSVQLLHVLMEDILHELPVAPLGPVNRTEKSPAHHTGSDARRQRSFV